MDKQMQLIYDAIHDEDHIKALKYIDAHGFYLILPNYERFLIKNISVTEHIHYEEMLKICKLILKSRYVDIKFTAPKSSY